MQNSRIVWEPLPGSQALALDSRAQHTLYTGSRGPGKTDCQLMRFRRRVGLGYGAFWRGIIFDREYKNLDDLVAKSERWFPRFDDGCKFLSAPKDYKWVWPTGEELLFRALDKEKEYDKFHGHEYAFTGFNELTKYPNNKIYDLVKSINRTSFVPELHTPMRYGHNGGPPLEDEDGNILYATPDGKPLPEIMLECFSTCNPSGVGHGWVKKRFIDPAPYGQIVRTVSNVYNPRTQQREDIELTQVAIFGSYRENRYLTPQYVAVLDAITDPNKRKAWLGGDWNVMSGAALDDLWDDRVHKVPRFAIPANWYVDRAFDWGSSSPFSVGWYAEANGEEITLPDGRKWAPQRGSLFRIAEWYGCSKDEDNVGLKLSAAAIAAGILDREAQMRKDGWINGPIYGGPADNQIRNVREQDVDTIEDKMLECDVAWEESDKSPGSRINGLQLTRDRLECALKHEGPALYFMMNCSHALEQIPCLPRDPDNLEDIDTSGEDHIWDELRYRVLASNNRLATKVAS